MKFKKAILALLILVFGGLSLFNPATASAASTIPVLCSPILSSVFNYCGEDIQMTSPFPWITFYLYNVPYSSKDQHSQLATPLKQNNISVTDNIKTDLQAVQRPKQINIAQTTVSNGLNPAVSTVNPTVNTPSVSTQPISTTIPSPTPVPLVTPTPTPVTVTENNDAITKSLACGSFGDVNADGIISKDDLELTRSFVLATAVPTDAQKHDADVNSDGKISTLDISLINAYRLGSFSTLPACDTAQVSITQFSGQNEVSVLTDSNWTLSAQGSDNTIRLTYNIDWGDGSTVGPISVNGGLFNVDLTHQYTNAGTYTITAKVNNLNSSSDSKTATVAITP